MELMIRIFSGHFGQTKEPFSFPLGSRMQGIAGRLGL